MKKKILSILTIIFALCACTFTLTACGGGGGNVPPHSHVYDQQVVNDTFKVSDATCEKLAVYKYSCICGEAGEETFEDGSTVEHDYGDWVSNNNGTHTKTCSYNNDHTVTENCEGKTCAKCGYVVVLTPTEGIVYEIDTINNVATVTGYEGTDTDVVIAEEYQGYPVTSIGEYAFAYRHSLTSVEIPDSITSIGDYAFSGCGAIDYIEFPSNLISIGKEAFYTCNSFTSIKIPSSLTSLGKEAFGDCFRLASIIVDENNENFKSIDGNLYSKDEKTLLQYAIGKTQMSFTIPSSVTRIGEDAFAHCYSLTSIEIPNSVKSIGYAAFNHCGSLTSLEIPNSVTDIDFAAFFRCSSLESIVLPNFITSISPRAFAGCSSLKRIEIPNSVISIGYEAFYGCRSLESTEIPNGVVSIGDYAFADCSSITNIVIPDSVTSIGKRALKTGNLVTTIKFNDTSTWYRTESVTDWENKTGGEETIVTDSKDNKTYFNSEYYAYYWYKI